MSQRHASSGPPRARRESIPRRSRETAADSAPVRRRRLAEPEGDVGRQPAGVLHAHHTLLDAQDPPRGVAELEDVAGHALDGEVLVERADEAATRLLADLVVGDLRDGPARGHGDEARAAPRAQSAVHGIAVQVGGAASPAAAVAFGQEPHDGRKLGAGERPIGVSPAHQIEEPVLVVVLGGDHRDELLGEHIDGTRRHREPVELPRRAASRRALHSMRSSRLKGNSRPLGSPAMAWPERPTRWSRVAMERGLAYLTAQIYLAHVDAELERCGRDQGPEPTLFEPRLGGQAVFARQATVVCRDAGGFAARVQALAQVPRDPLGHAPGVDEDDGRAVARYQIGETVIDLAPHLVRHDGRERALRQHEAQVPGTPVAHVHDVARALAAEIAGDLIDGPLGGREPDAPQGFPGQGIETRQAEREVGAALRRGHRMDLVHDHRVGGLEHRPPARTGQQDIEGFRGRDQDVRRRAAHAQALGRGGVAGAHPRPDRDVGETPAARARGRSPKEALRGCDGCRCRAP